MTSPEASAPVPRLLAPILVIGLLVGVFVVLAWPVRSPQAADRGAVASGPRGQTVAGRADRLEAEAAAVLRHWDARRAAAWAAGDGAALARLYVPGASAAKADVAMLRDWTARGLAVDDLTTQLLAVAVIDHGPRRWVLRVRDRVTGARVQAAGTAQPLPAGGTVLREVVLRRVAGAWRVASVRPARR